jgi:membrane-associated phospholipid phosphatase
MDAASTHESPNDIRDSRRKFRWLVPCFLILASAASLLIDVPLASVFAGNRRPEALDRSPLREVVEACEWFGHGWGATAIIIAVVVLYPRKMGCLPWMFAGSLGSGLVVDIVKLIIHRTRPRDFDLTGTVWETFTRESNAGISMQSFPSAHTATAFGLAVMLASLFPRCRWLFLIMAMLVGMQRIVSSAHFPSDVFAGAAVGWFVGTVCANAMMSRHETREAERSLSA